MTSANAARLTAAFFTLGAALGHQAATVNTSSPADIATFQSGATVEKFDSGLTGLGISSYNTTTVPAANQFSSRDINNANLPAFNSGGATFTDPANNPGTLVGIFAPQSGISGDVSSAPNVIGPLIVGSDDSFGSGFLEVIFQNPVSKVGFSVTHGSVSVFLKDINNSNFAGADSSVTGTAGNFIGVERALADIGGITILSGNQNDSFTLDDFTFAFAPATPGNGTGNGTTVPDAGSVWNFALAGVSLWLTGRRIKKG